MLRRRKTEWAALAFSVVIASACGPNAAPVMRDAVSTSSATPVAWRLEATATPAPLGPPTAGPLSAPPPVPTAPVQLPFDAVPPVHMHAAVALETPQAQQAVAGSGVSIFADIPLQLTAASLSQDLRLEVHADHRQFCLRATDAEGGQPLGPLFVSMTAGSTSAHMDGGVGGGADGTWAERWPPNTFPANAPITLALWVGGSNYVTNRAQTTVPPSP